MAPMSVVISICIATGSMVVSSSPVMVIWMLWPPALIFICVVVSQVMLLAADTFSLAACRTSSGVAGLLLAQAARERAITADMAMAALFLNQCFIFFSSKFLN